MMQMLARTRRSLSKLHQQVMNNQGDLEERIATDIAHLLSLVFLRLPLLPRCLG